MDEGFQNENEFNQKLEEYLKFKENIKERIEEIEMFYESHFDEPFVLNYEKGIIKLKKILIENKPNFTDDINKYISNIKYKTKKNLNNSNQKIQNKNDFILLTDHKDNNIDQINNNEIKIINESNLENNGTYKNNNNNSTSSILDNNIFNNKLLLRFQQKEKDLKNFELKQEIKNQKEENNVIDNELDNNNNTENNMLENDNNKIEEEKEENIDKQNIKNRKLIHIKNRNEYGDLFNLKNTTSDKKISTIKSDNNFSVFKEDKTDIFKEESKEEENSINEEVKEKYKLKEITFKFILTDAEYNILIEERAKNINPFKDNIN